MVYLFLIDNVVFMLFERLSGRFMLTDSISDISITFPLSLLVRSENLLVEKLVADCCILCLAEQDKEDT